MCNRITKGIVYLIGAGPGDPGLITVRGMEILRSADVVVYDRLAHPALLSYARADAELVYVGKSSAQHSMKQPDINSLLVDRAGKGLRVARLKGGDPFVFGRGGEEAEECRAAGIPFEIVPGVTSAIAAPAYAGIPVTHRDAASSFAVITGHERDDAGEASTRTAGSAEGRRNWAHIAHAADTLIFLMGVEALSEITARLLQHGRSPETPVALIQWGTWSKQRVVTGTLESIVEVVKAAGMTPPAVCVVGEVVRLREELQWFDSRMQRPLFGKRIVVTRAREQSSGFSELLRYAGAEPIEFPVIKIARLEDYSKLDESLRQLNSYDWVIFTSANTVQVIKERLELLKLDSRAFGSTKIAAIGPATADALRQLLSLNADFIPTEAVAEAIMEQWRDLESQGKRVLLPRALEARELLPERLRELGAHVDVITAYETTLDRAPAAQLSLMLENGEIDAITFTSSSTVRNFVSAMSGEGERSLLEIIGETRIAAIGPITAETARENGLTPHIIAAEHTIPGLMKALEDDFRTI